MTVILSACTPALPDIPAVDQLDLITVSGAFGEIPKVSVVGELDPPRAQSRQLIAGFGRKITDGSAALLRYCTVDSRTGEVTTQTYSSDPVWAAANTFTLGAAVAQGVIGQREGGRIVVLEPAASVDVAASITVVDILPSVATGAQQPQNPKLPTVDFDDAGLPRVAIPALSPPPDLQVEVLAAGSGEVVKADSSITVQSHAVRWADGTLVESTWADADGPLQGPLAGFIEGWKQALVGQRVGSRMMLVVPPDLATGDSTVVYVVDILAARPQR